MHLFCAKAMRGFLLLQNKDDPPIWKHRHQGGFLEAEISQNKTLNIPENSTNSAR